MMILFAYSKSFWFSPNEKVSQLNVFSKTKQATEKNIPMGKMTQRKEKIFQIIAEMIQFKVI